MMPIEVGGVADHVHMLLTLPSTLSLAKALQLIKGGSSKWVHETFAEHRLFGWQVKYGAFSVSYSQLTRAALSTGGRAKSNFLSVTGTPPGHRR
jgi:REP element-mobilizing transposase RayT